MSDANYDLSGYEADVVEHVLVGRARARMLEDVRQGKAWNVDLTRGELTIGGQPFRTQILGTFATGSNSYLWAWANPGAAEWAGSLSIAHALHARGAQPGQAVFREREVSTDWVSPNELAFVCGELSGGHPVFVGVHAQGSVLLLVTSLRLELEQFSLAYLPGVLLELPSITMGNVRACTRRFVERLGFAVTETPRSISGTRRDGTFAVTYDDQGRAVDVKLSAGGR